ncbi:hypothetical protein [Bradyrhizobium sp. Tv2a-2]|uniref:hypothetical protein n=1 Tax=Bradyrhizobium sp. Tv2a-2 TaxID=113395 RepID=UPI000405CDC0|nr:hypothetical protein [Bradyrhizobium sp. Tv2a-2]
MAGGSNYLDGEENLFGFPGGLPTVLPSGVGEQASAIVDAYLKRPEGLVYVTDKNGNPAFMKAAVPSMTYTVTSGAITAGNLVTVTVSPANIRPDMIGEVMVINRNGPDELEAVVVQGTSGNNTLTFQTCQFNHGASAELDVGLVITEERSMPNKRSIARYSKWPMPTIMSLMGRYAYGRRSDQVGGLYQEMNLLASVQTFGGPPQWIPISITQCSWSDSTGEIWVPAGMLLAYYSDVKIKYVAGFTASNVPDEIVRATASVAAALISAQAYGGAGLKMISAGDMRIERFSSTYLDGDSKKLLDRYKARLTF